jgi:hypothetical protein
MPLLLAFYILLDDFQLRDKDRLYLLPPLTLLWANLHGGFMAGLMLVAVFIAGNLLKSLSGGERGCRDKAKRLLVVLSLCAAASLLNPNGYNALLFPFKLTGSRLFMDSVKEWLSPNFHQALVYEYMLLLLVLVVGISTIRLTAIEALLVLVFTHMSLYSARYIPLFAIITAPIIGRRIEQLIRSLPDRKPVGAFISLSDRTEKTDSMARGGIIPIAAVSVVMALALSGTIRYGFDAKKHPVEAVKFIMKERPSGNMFNSDEFGDYVIYAAWPEYKVFIDGRLDIYGEDKLKEYTKVLRLEQGWDEVLRKYDINWIFYSSGSPLSAFLLESPDWRLIYSDSVASIFMRDTDENRALIGKYELPRPRI